MHTPHRSPSLEGIPAVARARAHPTQVPVSSSAREALFPSSSHSPGLTIVLKNWFTFFLLSVFLSPSDRGRKVWLRRGDALASSVPGTPTTESVRAAGEPRAAVRAGRREGDRGRVGAKRGRDRVPGGPAAGQAGAVCVPGPRRPSLRFAEPCLTPQTSRACVLVPSRPHPRVSGLETGAQGWGQAPATGAFTSS